MRRIRIVAVEVPRCPVVRLTFDDGLAGEIDLEDDLVRGPFFEQLRDEAFFGGVAIANEGRSFGWRLGEVGREIDFGADAARSDVETGLVEARAERYRRGRSEAAE